MGRQNLNYGSLGNTRGSCQLAKLKDFWLRFVTWSPNKRGSWVVGLGAKLTYQKKNFCYWSKF